MSRLNSLTPFKGHLLYNLDEVMAVFDFNRVIDKDRVNGIEVDLPQYDTVWIKSGEHNYYTNKRGDGFLHFTYKHLHEFKSWGINNPKQLLEFVIKTVSEGTAVDVSERNLRRIAYKIEINGKIEYLCIGIDDDKSIHTLFPANYDTKKDYIKWSSTFNNYIITYPGKVY